uniref:Uncharacterized protein n=1 Tax=Oryza meridionalis TaxID=40149 RepID=A0A0E0D5R6_9ORYZ
MTRKPPLQRKKTTKRKKVYLYSTMSPSDGAGLSPALSLAASRSVWSCSSCCSAAAGSRCGCVARICERNCPTGDSIWSGAIDDDDGGGSDSGPDGDHDAALTTTPRLLQKRQKA